MDLKRFARKLFTVSLPALLVAALVTSVAVEAWVRATWDPLKGRPGFFLSDAARGQRLAPNYRGWFAGVPVQINSLGLRDTREYALAKRPDTFRILVLGDSVTFGHASVYEHTYPYLLEQRLRAWRPDVDWQVWNAAVPGYNTSQELAQLQEVGPAFSPDLVVVGVYDNDLIDNRPVAGPGRGQVLLANAISFARRHVYSLEFYKRVYLQVAWQLSASEAVRQRLDHVATEELLLVNTQDATLLVQQALTGYDKLTDEEVKRINCRYGMKSNPAIVRDIQRDPGYPAWVEAVRSLQRLNRDSAYRIVFFLNAAPPACPDGDVFYDGGTEAVNAFLLRTLSEGTPAVSSYDEFRHLRPSQMPGASGHSLGNANAVKAGVLFTYLRDRVLPPLVARPSNARTGS